MKKNVVAKDLYGLIACGGKSTRMGTDKAMLKYHDIPQCYYAFNLLEPFCNERFLSCNSKQADNFLPGYRLLQDGTTFQNIGPMAGLLTAFEQFPGKNVIKLGCDYPFLSATDIAQFLEYLHKKEEPAAFYNEVAGVYEPLLAYYPHQLANSLLSMFNDREYSLQHFLKDNHALKFIPSNIQSIRSIDTMEDFIKTKEIINGI